MEYQDFLDLALELEDDLDLALIRWRADFDPPISDDELVAIVAHAFGEIQSRIAAKAMGQPEFDLFPNRPTLRLVATRDDDLPPAVA